MGFFENSNVIVRGLTPISVGNGYVLVFDMESRQTGEPFTHTYTLPHTGIGYDKRISKIRELYEKLFLKGRGSFTSNDPQTVVDRINEEAAETKRLNEEKRKNAPPKEEVSNMLTEWKKRIEDDNKKSDNWYSLVKLAEEDNEVKDPEDESENLGTAAVILKKDDKILLLQRGETAPWMPGLWNLPGGGIEEGETPEAAARRECWEETDLSPNSLTPYQEVDMGDEGKLYIFISEDFSGELGINYESSGSAWVDGSTLGAYSLVPHLDSVKNVFDSKESEFVEPFKR
jgi:8-oxo-dGTP diphosphatase